MFSTLLFYNIILGGLKGVGFQVNPYKPYLVNKTMAVKQFNLVWHEDELKLSKEGERLVANIVADLEKNYGKMWILSG